MKILLVGSTGLMGTALQSENSGRFQIIPKDHNDLEIKDAHLVRRVLDEEKPDYVINTSAYLGVEPCAANPGDAFAVNTEAVRNLSKLCDKRNICLVQFSTDSVFDGRKGDLYTEDDLPNPLNLYGMTKHMGDLFVRNLCRNHYIIRIPILFGPRRNAGSIFIDKMYRHVLSGADELRIADDVISCPSFSHDIAQGVYSLIDSGKEYGLYHIKNEGVASLYDFANVFFEKMGMPVKILRAKAADFSANETEMKPLNTALCSVKTDHMRPWHEAIDHYIKILKSQPQEAL